MSDKWTLYSSSVCFSSVLKSLVYRHYREIGQKIGQETEKNLICEAPPLKQVVWDKIHHLTITADTKCRDSTKYRKIFGDFSLEQMGDCMGIFNRPSDFTLAVGDWESLSLLHKLWIPIRSVSVASARLSIRTCNMFFLLRIELANDEPCYHNIDICIAFQ